MATTGIKAGPLRYRVVLQSPVVQTDDTGEPVITDWVDVCPPVWAAIETLSGREWLASAEFRPDVSTRIRIRWRTGVSASHRVVHGGTTYNIAAVLPKFEGMSELHLYCGSGVVTQGGQP
jgi:SPP1 family predicted phage head-tail adaptor